MTTSALAAQYGIRTITLARDPLSRDFGVFVLAMNVEKFVTTVMQGGTDNDVREFVDPLTSSTRKIEILHSSLLNMIDTALFVTMPHTPTSLVARHNLLVLAVDNGGPLEFLALSSVLAAPQQQHGDFTLRHASQAADEYAYLAKVVVHMVYKPGVTLEQSLQHECDVDAKYRCTEQAERDKLLHTLPTLLSMRYGLHEDATHLRPFLTRLSTAAFTAFNMRDELVDTWLAALRDDDLDDIERAVVLAKLAAPMRAFLLARLMGNVAAATQMKLGEVLCVIHMFGSAIEPEPVHLQAVPLHEFCGAMAARARLETRLETHDSRHLTAHD